MNSFKKEQSKKITFGKIKPQSISSGFRKVFNEAGQLSSPIASIGVSNWTAGAHRIRWSTKSRLNHRKIRTIKD